MTDPVPMWHDSVSRDRGETPDYYEDDQHRVLERENEQLRAALDKRDKDVKRLAAALVTAQRGNTCRDATVARVETVLKNASLHGAVLAADVEAALDGEN